jgi:hypothetical protein
MTVQSNAKANKLPTKYNSLNKLEMYPKCNNFGMFTFSCLLSKKKIHELWKKYWA